MITEPIDPVVTDQAGADATAPPAGAAASSVIATVGPIDDPDAPSRDFVQSFARGLSVIRAFSSDGSGLTLSDVARTTGLPRAAARRFLLTLQALGYVRSTGRVFTLSPRVLDLAHAYFASSGGDLLLDAINASLPNARASRADVHHRLLPRLMATAGTDAPN